MVGLEAEIGEAIDEAESGSDLEDDPFADIAEH